MARVGIAVNKPGGKNHAIKKKTRQGSGTFTKYATHKTSKLYRKKYRGQGR